MNDTERGFICSVCMTMTVVYGNDHLTVNSVEKTAVNSQHVFKRTDRYKVDTRVQRHNVNLPQYRKKYVT